MTPAERVDRLLAETVGSDLTSWEKHAFLPSIRNRKELTFKQERTLKRLETDHLGPDHDEES